MADRQFLEQLSRKLADEGKLIEAGWVALRLQAIPHNAPAVQLQRDADGVHGRRPAPVLVDHDDP
jgi:hypothetical protein